MDVVQSPSMKEARILNKSIVQSKAAVNPRPSTNTDVIPNTRPSAGEEPAVRALQDTKA
jgi:hypothetical protein